MKNNTIIYSIGDVGDLTYPYIILKKSTETIRDFVENKNELSEKVKQAKNPIIIIGQSVLKLKSSKYIFEEVKKFLVLNNKINKEWNSLNVLSNNASTVGSYFLNLVSSHNSYDIIDKIKQKYFDIVLLFGQENIKIDKSKTFVVYIGSHGDRGAEQADLILPGAAYTEQDGYFTNLEGKIQKAYKASYPPGEAKEDWQIINELSALIKRKKLYSNKDELIDSMMNYLNLNKENKNFVIPSYTFVKENINVEEIDYYHSNVIARASKTMNECKISRENFKKTGTEN